MRLKGLEPPRLSAPDPKSGAATNYATAAKFGGKDIKIFPDPATIVFYFSENSLYVTAFSFKKYCSSLVIAVKFLIFVRSDAEAPP